MAWAVFPTCVGVFLGDTAPQSPEPGLPHVRGGVSIFTAYGLFAILSSPRAWGCVFHPSESLYTSAVFPTCVGVFLPLFCAHLLGVRLPHVRGGVSVILYLFVTIFKVFPTCVGVFLKG